jgi:hypothetical protein
VIAVASLGGCGAGDDTTDGTRGQCAEGGALNTCPESERTAEGACWRLVDCAAIPLHSDDPNVFDWDNCVDGIQQLTTDRERLIVDCIAASSCDALKVDGSPRTPDTGQMPCLQLGGGL